MRVPLSWLSEFVEIDLGLDELCDALTRGGLVVEDVHRPGAGARGVRVARVVEAEKVPDTKLTRVEVDAGDGPVQVMCGASNFAPGDLVPVAFPGSVLPGGIQIGVRRMLGRYDSNGMICSARELEVGEDHRGIWNFGADAPLGADVAEWLGLDDPVLDLEVTPDRGYALSVLGVARDVAALTGARLRVPSFDESVGDGGPGPAVPVAIVDADRCPRFDARTIAGVRIGASPPQVQRRLAAAGMRPVSNVVDATNYAMLELGNPIHAYDLALLAGPRIEVRLTRAGETLRTLDGVERTLDPDDLVIADADGPVALAGVMGGEATEVGDQTTDLFLEVANFAAGSVQRTAQRHGLPTEGSKRWVRTVPPEAAGPAAARCAALITEWAGGTVVAHDDHYVAPPERQTITLHPQRAAALLGLDVDADRQAELLARIDCAVEEGGPALQVTPPSWRPDLRIPEDLCEEIARLEGYDAIPEELPSTGQVGGRSPEHEARRAVRRVLAGGGWTEVMPYPFVADADLAALGLDGDDPRLRTVALVNPLSKEEAVLRTTLLPGLLQVVRHNANRQTTDVAVFEIGTVFLPPTEAEPGAPGGPAGTVLPAEPLLVGFAACGAFVPPRWDSGGRAGDLGDLLGAADLVCRTLGHPPLRAHPTAEAPYHPGRAARLFLDAHDVGVVGELHPRVIAAYELPDRTLAGELRFDRLAAGGIRPAVPVAPSPLPGLRFDVAVAVPESTPAVEVAEAVRAGAGERLTGLDLFDVFRGPQLGQDRKSLAYTVCLDDPTRQLTADDEAAAIDAIAAAVTTIDGTLRR